MQQIIILSIFTLISVFNPTINERDQKTLETDCVYSHTTQVQVSTEKTVKFLWRGMKYDEELQDSINSIFINEEYCNSISDPEKAAIGYVATFVGNECWWDGKANDDRSNLKCIILTSLDLGYQCSEQHLGFLRKWFEGDTKALSNLENCPIIPYTSTIQNTFDEISLSVKGDDIAVSFKASRVNIREQKSRSWVETDYFKKNGHRLELVKVKRSDME